MKIIELSALSTYLNQQVKVQARLTGIKPAANGFHCRYMQIQVSDYAADQVVYVWEASGLYEALGYIDARACPAVEIDCTPVLLDGRLFVKVNDIVAISEAANLNSARLVPRLYVPSSGRPALQRLVRIIDGLRSSALRDILNSVLANHDLVKAFVRCGASWNHHHSYPGGLLAHSVEVAQFAAMSAIELRQDYLSVEVSIVAGLLHDFGKVIFQGQLKQVGGTSHSYPNHEVATLELIRPELERLSAQYPDEAELLQHLFERFAYATNKKATLVIVEDIVRAADCLSTIKVCGRSVADGLWMSKSDNQLPAANDDFY